MSQYSSYGTLDSRLFNDGDTGFVRMNNRLRPDQLEAGTLAYSQNGRMGRDGAWQTRPGVDYFAGSPPTSSESLVIPFYVYASVNISSATRSTTTVTVTTSGAHSLNDASQVGIAGLTGTVNPNGNRTISVTGATTFTFEIAGATGSETYSGTGTAGSPYIAEVGGTWGSCLYSDPSQTNAEYIVQAQTESAVAIKLSDGSSTTIAYPAGLTINADVELKQAFNKVYIFRDGATALEWDGDLGGGLAFAKVANGDYTQPTVFTTANNAACSGGVVTITETSHGLSVGTVVKIFDQGTTELLDQGFYTVATVPTANTFTFYADVDNFSATSVVLGKAQSEGLGFTHMPAPPWASYHQRRLIVPYFYTTTGSSGSETITSRNVTDEILFSDILDADTYDVLQANFRVTAGISDYVKAVHPFTDDNAVVFNRRSIHLLSGISGDLGDVEIKEITREAGLVARRSVVTIGNAIYFLSDNGIYATQFGDLYNLRGAGLPLSDAIQPVIDRINFEYAQNAVATFHDNRYWIAVPLDGSTVNNAILIYNILNGGWESVDVITATGWDIANLISGTAGAEDLLYAVSKSGGIHIVDGRDDDVDYLSLQAGLPASSNPIESYATTRMMTGGNLDRKRYRDYEMHIESSESNASDGLISGIAENLDADFSIDTLSGKLGSPLAAGEDASIRGRIGGKRAYGLQLQITPSQGRPKLRAVRVSGTAAFNSLTQAT